MNIAILGAGAMGMLFGGYLSKQNDVYLIDIDANRTDRINAEGVSVREQDASVGVYRPHAVTSSENLPTMDLMIVFVKAMFTLSALENNRNLIGENTYLMTLQNGAGHESKLLQFADKSHVIIGSTQHNSSVVSNGCIAHGGGGMTSIGLLDGDSERISGIAENLTACGIACTTSNEVKMQIWNKLFLNTAASSLTAVLQVPLGFILEDPYACRLMETMAREAVAVANAQGFAKFDESCVIGGIKDVLKNSKCGYTSIYADLKNGNRTEVDTISGSVLDAAHELNVPVPCHEAVVRLIHAMEDKKRNHVE